MAVTMFDLDSPTSDREIDAVERRLGFRFPIEYRRWLLRYNGGQPDPRGFRYKRESGSYTDGDVAWFLGVHDDPDSSFETTFTTLKVNSRRMPDNLVPIASDPFGNKICISCDGPDRGAIYFWDHEEEPPEPSYANCHLLANNFDEFVNGLH